MPRSAEPDPVANEHPTDFRLVNTPALLSIDVMRVFMIAGLIASETVGFELGNSSIDYFNDTGYLSLDFFLVSKKRQWILSWR